MASTVKAYLIQNAHGSIVANNYVTAVTHLSDFDETRDLGEMSRVVRNMTTARDVLRQNPQHDNAEYIAMIENSARLSAYAKYINYANNLPPTQQFKVSVTEIV